MSEMHYDLKRERVVTMVSYVAKQFIHNSYIFFIQHV